jgi:hypothetical protein
MSNRWTAFKLPPPFRKSGAGLKLLRARGNGHG